MKKYLALIILSLAMVSCYDNYILDYTYTGVYFPYQIDVRSFVVGEGMKIEVGAALGGVRKNTVDRDVSFILDNTLITPLILAKMKAASQPYIKDAATPVTALAQMPADYVTMSNTTTMVIKAGQHMGAITIRPDSVKFLTDSVKTLIASYVMPFKITDADADSVIAPKNYNIVAVRFENKFFGNYWHGGAALVNRPGKTDTTIVYKTTIPVAETKIWNLKTIGPQTLTTKGYLDQVSTKDELKIVFKGGKVYVSAATGSTNPYLPEGTSKFNGAKLLQDRRIVLKYKYTNATSGYTYHCTDTLTFRNRVRDGINEWQDENPANYVK